MWLMLGMIKKDGLHRRGQKKVCIQDLHCSKLCIDNVFNTIFTDTDFSTLIEVHKMMVYMARETSEKNPMKPDSTIPRMQGA